MVVAALAVAVAAFFLLRPADEEPEPAPAASTTPQQEPDEGERGAGGGPGEEPRSFEAPTIHIEDGQPVGGVQEIEAKAGEKVRFVVVSDAPDELHLHGYELTEEVTPSSPALFEFEADLEGIYELEAHDAGHVTVAEVRVEP